MVSLYKKYSNHFLHVFLRISQSIDIVFKPHSEMCIYIVLLSSYYKNIWIKKVQISLYISDVSLWLLGMDLKGVEGNHFFQNNFKQICFLLTLYIFIFYSYNEKIFCFLFFSSEFLRNSIGKIPLKGSPPPLYDQILLLVATRATN